MPPFWKFICTVCGHRDEPCEHYEEKQLRKDFKELRQLLYVIIGLLNRSTGFTIRQLQGETPMPITGIVAGASGTFQETPTPAGSKIPDGTVPVWTSPDSTIGLAPSADGTQVVASVPAGSTITSFDLTVANHDGSFPTTVPVPVTQPVVAQTGFEINQIA